MIKMNMKRLLTCAPVLVLLALGGCASTDDNSDALTKITRHQASDMEQLCHVGNIWISEQPTQRDLLWMRDNAVTLVIDARGREEDRGFDERAYVVSLGMQYHPMPLETDQDYVIRYFDRSRNILNSRRDIPTLIHGESADRAAAIWMVSRVLDDEVPYRAALAEAEVAGLQNEATLLLVQQYLLGKGVTMDLSAGLDGAAVLEAEDGPDEVIYRPAGSGSASESGAEVDPVSSGETRGASDSRFE